jgi:hypothetical protein
MLSWEKVTVGHDSSIILSVCLFFQLNFFFVRIIHIYTSMFRMVRINLYYEAHLQSKFPWGRLQKQNTIFIATDTASVQLFFNVFATGIETFVIPWD